MTAMVSARTMGINDATATQRRRNVQQQRDSKGRPVVVINIKIEKEDLPAFSTIEIKELAGPEMQKYSTIVRKVITSKKVI